MKKNIKGIIAEMREFIKNPTIGTKTECEVKLENYLKGCMKDYADRIEEAVAKMETTTPTCKESLQVQTMDEWAYPLTNVCKCGNNQEAKPCATVKDANGVVLLHFNGNPWRSNKDSTAMATDFCKRMNAQGNKPVGNAAKMREELMKVSELIHDEAKWADEMSNQQAIALGIIQSALAAPPRNCDRFKTKEEAALAYAEECHAFIPQSILWQIGEWLDWLFAEAKGVAE